MSCALLLTKVALNSIEELKVNRNKNSRNIKTKFHYNLKLDSIKIKLNPIH